ncbi:hypothetical protein [Tunturibacter empetritectus]|uniref:Uncharacterized protein n=1 Tax=Tunturiibacter lichenicola TaxID=2051959 RepID=A0A7W8N5P8_9BACT|nr:hypothetical protein [Edaphobacter lichenicola]MBB5344776.1 hypothetical protein [Edaphobacter lichenicola]
MLRPRSSTLLCAVLILSSSALAQNQTVPNQTIPGPGNAQAVKTAQASPLVQSAYDFLIGQTFLLKDSNLRYQTLDALANPNTCILHRANLKLADKQNIVAELLAQGLLNRADDTTFPGGLLAGVFPPVLHDPSACPQLPQSFWSAPGSAFGSHHSYPGGLPVHESNNDTADINLGEEYAHVYGSTDPATGTAALNILGIYLPHPDNPSPNALKLDHDLLLGAPLWHDWAKSIVFQWNADGSEFLELSIGGSGAGLDNYGAAGDARTGGHHILSIAESMLRGFSPAFIITQASAHSAPTSGNEFKVVNWIRAAAIIARLDLVAKGYLITDSHGNLRLPALRQTGQVDLLAAGQTNILTEYELHNLSDADFTFSGPAVAADQLVLAQLAPAFGYDPTQTAVYNNRFRNVVLSNYSAERLYTIYSHSGLDGVRNEIAKLHAAGKL